MEEKTFRGRRDKTYVSEGTMRPRKKGATLKRKQQIGHAKILTTVEQKCVFDYLAGNQRGINGKWAAVETPAGARAIMIYQLLLTTGLRVGELCSLRICDTPRILGSDVIAVYKGKNNKDREVPVSKRIADALNLYIDVYRPKTMPKHHKRSDIKRPVFYSHIKKPCTPDALRRLFKRVGIQAGLGKRLHPHMLRHSFAVNSIRNNVDIYLLRYLMGHASIQTTTEYLHIGGEQMFGLGEQLDINFQR